MIGALLETTLQQIADWRYRSPTGDQAPIDRRLIADQSQIGRCYTAKIPALFVVKPIAAPSEIDLRLTYDLFETSRPPIKPLSDQISHGQSFMHAQKTAHEQFVPTTDRRSFGDFNESFPRPLRPLCDCHFFFGRKAITTQSHCVTEF